MIKNNWEWVKDWYNPEYYSHSPIKGPQGPEQPVFKDVNGYYTRMLRSQGFSGPEYGLTMVHYKADPDSGRYSPDSKAVHCVVNRSNPVK